MLQTRRGSQCAYLRIGLLPEVSNSNSQGTLWTSLPVGWMDGVAVGFRGVGKKFTRPGLVKGLSLVKAYNLVLWYQTPRQTFIGRVVRARSSLQKSTRVRGAIQRASGPARRSVAATAAPQSPARAKRAAPSVLGRVQSRVRYLAEGTAAPPRAARRAQTPPPRLQPRARRAPARKKSLCA